MSDLAASLSQARQKQDCRSGHKEGNELGCREWPDASPDQISSEKFNDKSADTVKEQIAGHDCTGPLAPGRDPGQHKEIEKVQSAGIELGRNQCHVIRRKIRMGKHDMQCACRLISVAAACQETAKPTKSLGQRNRRKYQIRIPQKRQFSDPAVEHTA